MMNLGKKMAILSVFGILQCAFSLVAPQALAAPHPERYEQSEPAPDREHERREHERHERERIENERHEREMERRRGEDERAWHDRQQAEQHRHDEAMQRIAKDILELVFDKQ